MGFPYLYTFFYHYPWLTTSPPKQVNLKRKTIIVDGNSTMYSIYDKAVNDDKTRIKTEQVTKTPFGYDKYGNLMHEVFSQFRKKCKKVIVVFDGVYRRHRHRRSDPDRMSSLRFAALNQHGTQLPSLFEHKFKSVLNKLDIEMIVARGEADPMIAALAEDLNAYVVAGDSDYHLYNLKQGYVPLKFLDFEQMEGSLYQTENIFGVVDSYAVPLWTSLIGYDFVSWDNLQKLFVNFEPYDAQKFHEWLESTDPDKEKRLRITNMFYLLRLIQDRGGQSVHDAVIQYVPEEQVEEFHQVRRSYRRITVAQTIRTRGQRGLPSYIDRLFVRGNLDRAVINLFINRKLLLFEESDNHVYFKFLLPILQLILKWDRPDVGSESCSSIIFNGQQYNPLESINEDELPSADEMEKLPQEQKKKWLLTCVQSALGPHMIVDADRIREGQLVWICLLKLWYHTTAEQRPTKDTVLRAMTVAYLNRKLLAAAAADPPKCSSTKTTTASPSISKFVKRLKKEVSFEERHAINKAMMKNASANDDDDEIKKDLVEFERFYRVFHIGNQFFDLPLPMPDPSECGIEEAYYFAISIRRWADQDREICKRLFQNNAILTDMFTNLQEMVKRGPPPAADAHERTDDGKA